jgi:biopolymer transport protein ExbD
MADITQSNNSSKGQKISTKIDMTPMVDLGFLLITFFMLTTTLQKPSEMQLNMPDKFPPGTTEVEAEKTLALVPASNNKVYYYRGDLSKSSIEIGITDYSSKGLRSIIQQNKVAVEALPKGLDKFVVVIMPMEKASYKNVVDILDEMAITNSTRYAIVDLEAKVLEKVKTAKVYIL